MVLEIKQNLINEFKGIIKDSFGDYLIYSFLTGSLNYKYYKDFINNSDVDLMIVLSNDIILSHELKKCRQKFNSYYLQLHTEYSLKPDLVFPGEVISEAMLEEVKLGRGFEKHSEKLFYREISGENEEWLLNHDLEYRCWRSMFFFTKNESFISGEYNKFLSDRNEIILPFIFYLLEYPQKPLPSDYNFLKIRIEQKIKNSCINEFGYCNSYESNLFGENSELIGIPIKEVLINSGILIKNTEKIDIEILEKKILKFLNELISKEFRDNVNPFIIKK